MGANRLPLRDFLNFVATPFFSLLWLILVIAVLGCRHARGRKRKM